MNINKVRNDNELTLEVSGRLDTMTAPELETVIMESLEGVVSLVLDFNGLEYISSAGLRILLAAQKIMNKQGSMKVRNVIDDIKEVFEMTGFSDILTIE